MFWKSSVLAVRLFFDKRVSTQVKLIPIFYIFYLLSPIDLIPEAIIPFFGVIDDVGLFVIFMNWFINAAPQPLIEEHLTRIGNYDRLMQMLRGVPFQAPPQANKNRRDENVIDGEVIR